MNKDKVTETVLIVLCVICFITLMVGFATPVYAEEKQPELKEVEVTAYYDYLYHLGIGADGRKLVEGLTIASKKEWMGYTIALYDLEYRLIGLYEVRDTGYGKMLDWRYGKSKLRQGKPIGDIEAGLTLDLYFKTYEDCLKWGRKKCYMQLIKAVG